MIIKLGLHNFATGPFCRLHGETVAVGPQSFAPRVRLDRISPWSVISKRFGGTFRLCIVQQFGEAVASEAFRRRKVEQSR